MRRVLPVLLATTLGCASIIHGTTQDVSISTNPAGALITVDGRQLGRAPVIANLRRGDNHTLRAELDGYAPYEMAFTKSVSGWVLGNILFGGLIGLAVDAISGGLYYLTPEQVMGELRGRAVSMADGDLAVFVVLEAKPEWTLVAQLRRAP